MKPNPILIALFSLILQQTSWASQFHPQEFCHLFEPETDQNMTPSLTATPISVSQVFFSKIPSSSFSIEHLC